MVPDRVVPPRKLPLRAPTTSYWTTSWVGSDIAGPDLDFQYAREFNERGGGWPHEGFVPAASLRKPPKKLSLP